MGTRCAIRRPSRQPPSELRRERISTPLLRDERPEVVLRQLDRIARARAGDTDDDGAVT